MKCVTTKRRRLGFLAAAAGGVVLALAPSASAQYSSDFESLAPGIVTGQDGYYLPNATSADYTVETYSPCVGACDFDTSTGPGVCDLFDFLAFQGGFAVADPCACDLDTSTGPGVCDLFDFLAFQGGFAKGEAGGVPVNPTGGDQYIKGVGPAGNVFARAQRDISWPVDVATMSYDVLCDTTAAPGANNLGSFSIQPFPGSASFIQLFEWMPAPSTNWRASLIGYSSAGTQFPFPYPVPGPEWEDLEVNKWYRFSITVDFSTNAVIEATITDIETGITTTAPVLDTFLEGGTAGGAGLPTGFRFFAGSGGTAGNFVCWDNPEIN